MAYHDERLTELLRELAAEFISLESNRQSLITVTNVRTFDNNKNATIYFTVLPADQEAAALDFLKRRRSDFRGFVKEKAELGRIPFFDFEIDLGEKNRQRIEEISIEDEQRRKTS